MSQVDDWCQVCTHPRSDHPYRHAFIGKNDQQGLTEVRPPTVPPPDQEATPASVRVAPPGDPVLRLVLIRKGLISLEDIDGVEAELKGAGIAYHDPEALG